MTVRILLDTSEEKAFYGVSNMRYNPSRGVLIIDRYTDPNLISCPEIFKVPISHIVAISAHVEERK